MSTTIDSLAIQISSDIGDADIKIERLAAALGKLKENAGLTKVTNSLNKLSTSFSTLNTALNGLNLSRLREFSAAMEGMANIQKLSGLNSALNGLKKISEVIDALDAADLKKFVTQIKRLSDALEPLAIRIKTIADGFAKLPSQISKTITATNRMTSVTEKLNGAHINLAARLTNLGTLISSVQHIVQTMAVFLSQAIEWDGIQFRFGQSFGEDAQEVYDWIVKINEALGINIQEFMQYSGLYASLLKGFGLSQDKVTEIAVGLTELSYDIWAFSNDRFKSVEEASEAIRSAITGEIEPIRNAGIALTEASLQEYIDSTHLAGISIEKLTEAQKAEVRYAAMVDSAMSQGIIGTYAREMDTAEGAVRQLSQSLKSLTQAFGSLFIPILQLVVPYVTAFVELLTDAVFWVANLFGIEIQALDWSNVTKGVGGLADGAEDAAGGLDSAAKAAKKLKDYTMGFDELNVISPDSGGGAGGGAGAGGATDWGSGLDLKSIWDEGLLAQANKQVDELKEKIKAFLIEWKWGIVGAVTALKLFATATYWIQLFTWGKKIGDAIKGIGGSVGGLKTLFDTLSGGATTFHKFTLMHPALLNIWHAISAAGKAVGTFVAGLSGTAMLAITAAIAAVASVVYYLYENWEKVKAAAVGFFETQIVPKLDEMRESWDRIKVSLIEAKDAIVSAIPEPVIVLIKIMAESMKRLWSEVVEFVKSLELLRHIKEIFKAIGDAISTAITWVVEFVKKVEWMQLIKKIFEVIGGIIFNVLASVVAGAFKTIMGIIETAMSLFADLAEIVSGVVKFIVALFTGDLMLAWDAVKQIASGIIGAIVDMCKLVIGTIVDFVSGVIGWFTEMWDELVGHSIVPDTVEGIIEWFLKLPKKILGPLGDFKDDVIAKFKELWSGVKSWYTTNIAPKFTKQYWVDTFSSLKDGFIQSIKNAVNGGIELMNGFIGYINSALNFSWDALKIAGKEVYPAGSIQLFTIPTIPKFENGGFIEVRSLVNSPTERVL